MLHNLIDMPVLGLPLWLINLTPAQFATICMNTCICFITLESIKCCHWVTKPVIRWVDFETSSLGVSAWVGPLQLHIWADWAVILWFWLRAGRICVRAKTGPDVRIESYNHAVYVWDLGLGIWRTLGQEEIKQKTQLWIGFVHVKINVWVFIFSVSSIIS